MMLREVKEITGHKITANAWNKVVMSSRLMKVQLLKVLTYLDISRSVLTFGMKSGVNGPFYRLKQFSPYMEHLGYRIVMRKEPEGGYTVIAPSLPGCVTYGDSVELWNIP
jgi:hypothetical protein